ncbi:MAG: succinylglutamate desuccinylase/aspartoacylase family protein [Saprospiraceae bacterium]
MDTQKRIIGIHKGQMIGPLVIAIGGMHGNEPAGVRAIDMLLHMLSVEPLKNPAFVFKGVLVGIKGNVRAFEKGIRYIVKDLNRQFLPAQIAAVRQTDPDHLMAEDAELRELLDTVDDLIEQFTPKEVILIDLHTTTADGGIFSIATDDPRSIEIATFMHAPVITGMLNGLKGTTLHHFHSDNYSCPVHSVTFEAGQHDDPLSTRRAVAALVNLLRSTGCVKPEDVENKHDDLLINYSRGLPRVARLRHVHPVGKTDQFTMLPGYVNFQPLRAGEVLATDKNGPIKAPYDCRILMPLYQPQGEDGFFLISENY